MTEDDKLCYWNTENYSILDRNFKTLYYKTNYAEYSYGKDEALWIDKSNNLYFGNEEDGWKIIASDVKKFAFGGDVFFYETQNGKLYFSPDVETEWSSFSDDSWHGWICKTNQFTTYSLDGVKAINLGATVHILKEDGTYQILETDYEIEGAQILAGTAKCRDFFL